MKTKYVIPFLVVIVLLFFGCGSAKKTTHKTVESEQVKVPVEATTAEKDLKKDDQEVKDTLTVREEKLVETPEAPVPKEKYFVIIGSFRIPGNAEKYMQQIRDEGFSPYILRNEQGLYRVAVFSYDDEQKARDKVHAIWKAFPQHGDTWLLIKAQ